MKKTLYVILLICIGVVAGMLVSSLSQNITWLSWLSFGREFGLTSPFVLNLGIIVFTLGMTINLNISVIIFVLLSLFVGSKIKI
jgi:hypothetical protein